MELTPDWQPLKEEPEALLLMTKEELIEAIIVAMIEEGQWPGRRRRRRAHRRAFMLAPPQTPPHALSEAQLSSTELDGQEPLFGADGVTWDGANLRFIRLDKP